MKTLYLITLLVSSLTLVRAQIAGIHDHLQRADEYLKSKDQASASREFEAVLALDPRNAEANANLGVIAFFHGDYENASRHLRRALETDPSLAKAQGLLGISERRLGRRSAQELLEKAFSGIEDKPLRTQVGLELANLHYQQGDLDQAATVMRRLVDVDPDNVEILYMAQRVYSELADDTLNKLAMIAPGSARMQQVIAERLVNEGDLKGAAEHYRKALGINPHLPGVHFELAEAILELAPDDAATQTSALQELETAVKFEGDSARAECVFGRIALRRADLTGAYAHYNRAFALNSGDGEALVGLGRVLATMDKPEEAAKYLRMAVQSDPLNDEAHYRLASICKRLQLKDESQRELRLFQEIRDAKERLSGLYFQMNRKPPGHEEQVSDAHP